MLRIPIYRWLGKSLKPLKAKNQNQKMKEENQKPWRYPPETPLIRNEVNLSVEHQARLDYLISEHPTINTRAQMFRALLDNAPINQVKTVSLEQSQINQIARLGNLLNQYARLAYTYAAVGEPIAATVLHAKIDKANRLLSEILKAVKRNDAA